MIWFIYNVYNYIYSIVYRICITDFFRIQWNMSRWILMVQCTYISCSWILMIGSPYKSLRFIVYTISSNMDMSTIIQSLFISHAKDWTSNSNCPLNYLNNWIVLWSYQYWLCTVYRSIIATANFDIDAQVFPGWLVVRWSFLCHFQVSKVSQGGAP